MSATAKNAVPVAERQQAATAEQSGGARILMQLVRDAALSRFKVSSQGQGNCKCDEIQNPDDFAYGHWLSFILLSGKDIQIIFRAHFMSADIRAIVASALRRANHAVKPSMIMDFMREYCNLTAGEIKAKLANVGILTGLSLPLITRGFDELIFSDKLDPQQIRDYWQLTWEGGGIRCTSAVRCNDWDKLNVLALSEPSATNTDSDIDFL